ncbi:MAG TPA: porin [Devosiaceae bacterium]|nr:porin [Devosiaceae bacterium]
MKRSFAISVGIILGLGQWSVMTPPASAAVEYVRVCSLYGAHFFYDPGTATCINAQTGVTKTVTATGVVTGVTQTEQDALDAKAAAEKAQESANKAQEGAALGLSLPGTTVDPGKHFGASAHVGTFNGYSAVGVGGAFRLNDDVTFDGGIAVGTSYGTVGGRAGVNVSW